MISLQIDITSSLSLVGLITKGGWIMLPIIIMSVISFYIFFERILALRTIKTSTIRSYKEIIQFIKKDNHDTSDSFHTLTSTPLVLMAQRALLLRGKAERKEIEGQMESIGRLELIPLEKGLSVLSVIASIAPMFGFLGTIIGVIKIFFDISMSGDVSIDVVSAGLYVKMIASAAGLMVGLISFLFYNILNGMVNRLTILTERYALSILDKTTLSKCD